MKRTIIFSGLLTWFMIQPVSADIINVPGDSATIQTGINGAMNMDTVLVQPGNYNENLSFNGTNLVLASLYLTTGDTSYISSTVLDGNLSGTVVSFTNQEDSTATLVGFTVTNGSSQFGGGICCDGSSPTIRNNFISGNTAIAGGGISCRNGSSARIISNIIVNNSSNGYGGGIFCWSSNSNITNNIICDNKVGSFGGGISAYQSDPIIVNNTISRNIAETEGGISHIRNNNITVRNSILWGNVAISSPNYGGNLDFEYCDVQGGVPGIGNINEDPLFVRPFSGNYNICSNSPCIDEGDSLMYDPDSTRADIGFYFPEHPACEFGNVFYVSITGDDETGDGSINNPFRTIQHGIDFINSHDTVIVQNGVYDENIDFKGRNITIASQYILSENRNDILNTIINGGEDTSVVVFSGGEDSSTTLIGFTIINGSAFRGGGIYCNLSYPNIISNIIKNNTAIEKGGGIYLYYSPASIRNNIVCDNLCYYWGGGIYCDYSPSTIVNNTLVGNKAEENGGAIFSEYNEATVVNCAIWTNPQHEVSGPLSISYCISKKDLIGPGNISENPLFLDIRNDNYNYCLQSPCIDSGDPSILDPDGTRSDIGVYFPSHPNCDFGNIWYVSLTGNDNTGNGSYIDPFRTIQHAIDMAFHADTIVVANGVYHELINFYGKNMLLTSNYLFTSDSTDIVNTVIDGDSAGSVVTLVYGEDSLAVINGLTIQDGYSDLGGGIFCYMSDPRIQNSIIKDNRCSLSGAGIYCRISDLSITGNIIRDNLCEGSVGGGISSVDSSNTYISQNTFEGNYCFGGGGAIFIHSSHSSILENLIRNNTASLGGAIYCQYSSDFNLIDNEIAFNNAVQIGGHGGGIYVADINSNIYGNFIHDNVSNGGGGGIFSETAWYTSCRNNVIVNNSAYGGGGIYWGESRNSVIRNNTISNNTAVNYAGGIFASENTSCFLTNNILWDDSAGTYQEIYVNGDLPIAYCDVQGGWAGEGNIDCAPEFCFPDTGNFMLAATSCCLEAGCDSLGNPDSSFNIGALDIGCILAPCEYVVGDVNGSGSYNGLDIVYGVNFFKGGPSPLFECECTPGNTWYVSGDVNSSCNYNGLDITYGVSYFKGSAAPVPCEDCPPAGLYSTADKNRNIENEIKGILYGKEYKPDSERKSLKR